MQAALKGDFHCSGAGSPLSSSFSEVEGGWAQQKVSFSSGSARVSQDLGGLDKVQHCLERHSAPLLPGNSFCDTRE